MLKLLVYMTLKHSIAYIQNGKPMDDMEAASPEHNLRRPRDEHVTSQPQPERPTLGREGVQTRTAPRAEQVRP